MIYENMTKGQLVTEITRARQYIAQLEGLQKKSGQSGDMLERYCALFENSTDPVIFSRQDGGIIMANRAAINTYGYQPDELLKMSIYDLYAPDTIVFARHYLTEAGNQGILFETIHQNKKGNIFYAEVSSWGASIDDELVLLSIIRDITERKLAEKRLQTTSKQLEDIIEFLPDATFAIDSNKRVIAWNKAMEIMTGISKEDIIGRGNYIYAIPFWGIKRPILIDLALSGDISYQRYYHNFSRAGNTNHAEGYIQTAFNGKGAYLRASATALYNTAGVIVGAIETVRDITDRRQMEDELRQHRDHLESLVKERTDELMEANKRLQREIFERQKVEAIMLENQHRYEALLKALPVGLFYNDADGLCIYVNEQVTLITGCSPDRLIGMNWINSIHPEDRDRVLKEWKRCQEEQKLFKMDYRFIGDNGQISWAIVQAAPYTGHDGKFLGYVGTLSDITEHKHMEEKLATERERLYSLLDGLPAFVYLQAEDYSIRFNNKYFRKQFGETGARYCYQILQRNNKPCEECPTFKVFRARRPGNWEWVLPDGKTYHMYNYPFNDPDGTPLVLVMGIDITERKQFEKELARLDRLYLIGEMAAGISHEIRNPMTTVRGFLQMLSSKKQCAQFQEYYNLMIDELDRANSIITEFLSLARNRIVNLKLHNINNVVNALLPMLQANAMITDHIIDIDLGELPDTLIDEREIRQLILNLVRNGTESMPPGGKLTIRTRFDGQDVVLSVQDEGRGIAPEILDKLGTPFFTTKDNGTGLGLAVCYSIAARHNATIHINTGPGGTCFIVRFKNQGNQGDGSSESM